jgi:hypothetical protein
MNRFLQSAICSALLFGALAPAHAATASSGFSVTASLTSQCQITTAPSAVAFTYTSFQTTAAPSTGGAFALRCTSTLPYTLALSATSGTVPGVSLAYTLSLSATSGTGAGLTTASYTINGSMAAGQSGVCSSSATACTGTDTTQTVTITY